MSTPNGPGTPNRPDGPAQQPNGPQFTPGQGQSQPQQGYQGPTPGYSGGPVMQPIRPQQPGPQTPQQPGQPGQSQPYVMGYTQQNLGQQSPKKPKTGLWIGLGAVAVVVVVALVVVLSGVFSGGSTAEGGSSGQPQNSNQSAKDIATNYLTAISEGRADDAKKMLNAISSDTSLLTDDVLKDSLTRAPITDISVTEPAGGSSSTVNVTYKVNGEEVSDEYHVDTRGGKIIASPPSLSFYGLKGVEITVNGLTVKDAETRYAVFPGSYTIASANKYLEIDGDNTTVLVTKSGSSDMPTLKPKVSQAGIDLFREKVIPEAKACLESKNLDPGCNMALSGELRDGKTLEEGSITRTQTSENASKLENVVPEPGTSVPTIISANDLGSFKVTGTCTDSGRTGECEIYGFGSKGLRFPKVSLNTAEDDPKVVWEDS